MACISNSGRWRNVTGHVFAASSAYGCGGRAWDPRLEPTAIHRQWAAMTFPPPAAAERAEAQEDVAPYNGERRLELADALAREDDLLLDLRWEPAARVGRASMPTGVACAAPRRG